MKPAPHNNGYTLIEVLVALTIAAILLIVAVPATRDIIDSAQRRSAINDLLGFMATARRQAVMTQQVMTVCPLTPENTCGKNWNRPLSLFMDPLNQRKLTSITRLVRVLPAPETGTLNARSLSSSYFQYRPNGMMYSGLGNITWCPESGDVHYAAHLIINKGGRLRIGQDNNGDGIPERSDGHPVEC